MKRILFQNCILLLFIFFFLSPAKAQQDVNWTLLTEQEGIKLYRAYTTCGNETQVLIKIENLNQNAVTVTWHSKFLVLNNEVETEDTRATTVEGNSALAGNCEATELKINPFQFVSIFEPGDCHYIVSNLIVQ